jgi:hypothetical protein
MCAISSGIGDQQILKKKREQKNFGSMQAWFQEKNDLAMVLLSLVSFATCTPQPC